MDSAGKIGVGMYDGSPGLSARLLTIGLQLALYGLYSITIIIRLLQTMVGGEISS